MRKEVASIQRLKFLMGDRCRIVVKLKTKYLRVASVCGRSKIIAIFPLEEGGRK